MIAWFLGSDVGSKRLKNRSKMKPRWEGILASILVRFGWVAGAKLRRKMEPRSIPKQAKVEVDFQKRKIHFKTVLGQSWSRHGSILGHLGRAWGHLGAILSRLGGEIVKFHLVFQYLIFFFAYKLSSWPVWRPSWGLLGRSWGLLGRTWVDLGA